MMVYEVSPQLFEALLVVGKDIFLTLQSHQCA